MAKDANLEAIARKADVAPVTVWRVLHNRPNVAQDTRAKVVAAMRDLGKPIAGKLVGLIVPDASNPFFAALAFAFEKAFADVGMHLLISSSDGRLDREIQVIERLRALGIRGLIYVPADSSPDTLLRLVADDPLACVVLDRRPPIAGNFDFVSVDSRQGTQAAVDYLRTYGHEAIGYLKGPASAASATERFDSFCAAMKLNGLALRSDWIFEGDFTLPAGRACAEKLLALPEGARPTAILAANDLMAIGLMQRVQDAGWRIPDYLSVIGFDDILWSYWTQPALTTIAQPIEMLVGESVRLLQRRIDELARNAVRRAVAEQSIKPRLIPRASVAPPRPTTSPRLELVSSPTDRPAY